MTGDLSDLAVEFVSDHILAIGFGFTWLVVGIAAQKLGERLVRPRESN